MNINYILGLLLLISVTSFGQTINFPDPDFKSALLNHTNPVIDTNSNGEIEISEAEVVPSLYLSGESISSLEGLEFFTGLVIFDLSNNDITDLDLTFLTTIDTLYCWNNPSLIGADLSTILSISSLASFENLPLIQSIDLSGLNTLDGDLTIKNNPSLNLLDISNLIGSSGTIRIEDNLAIPELNFDNFQNCHALYVTGNTSLQQLNLDNLQDLSEGLLLTDSNIVGSYGLPSLNSAFAIQIMQNNGITELSFPSLAQLVGASGTIRATQNSSLSSFAAPLLNSATGSVFIDNNPVMSSIDLQGLVSVSENVEIEEDNLTSVDLTNLQTVGGDLVFKTNTPISLDLGALTTVTDLDFSNGALVGLSAPNLQTAVDLHLFNNALTDIDLSSLISCNILSANDNDLQSIDISNLQTAFVIDVSDNDLSELDISSLSGSLFNLTIHHNQISNVSFGNSITDITNLFGQFNSFSTLDLSEIPILGSLNLNANLLESLFIKNGTNESVTLIGNSDLEYICADPGQVDVLDSATFGVEVNDYCTLVPGGEYFVLEGEVKFDLDGNGCGPNDLPVSNVQFEVFDGNDTSSISSNGLGNYFLAIAEGQYTVTPTLEYPDYFIVQPEFINIDFPTQPSPTTQDFCLLPNGVKNDLEIIVMPVTVFRPGFDGELNIIIKNNGNQVLSGDVSLTFDDDVMDYVESVPLFDQQNTNEFIWNYSDLLPFETRVISIVFNVNPPTATPPVNIDDVLTFEGTITPIDGDETPENNVYTLNEIVVGSFDPNDKTCLQGEVVAPEFPGDFAHYLIRFENLGTFMAENVIIKDVISLEDFDMSSFQPLASSHDYVLEITDNIVEFIFEGINLPFNDEDNDGYVLFRIRTLPDLEIGDDFRNQADIYFDFNFPIITNQYVTVIEEPISLIDTTTLDVEDAARESDFIVYPNPASDLLYISYEENLKVQYVSIYDLAGRSVLTIEQIKNGIDVSQLNQGTYLMEIKSDNGISYFKVVKE